MARLVFYCMPLIHLINQGIRNDFEAAMTAIGYANFILNYGFVPQENGFNRVPLKGDNSPRLLWLFGRHFPEASDLCLDVSRILNPALRGFKAYAYEGMVEIASEQMNFNNAITLLMRHGRVDSTMERELLRSGSNYDIYRLFVDSGLLAEVNAVNVNYNVPPLWTVFLAFMIADDESEFHLIEQDLRNRGINLRGTSNSWIKLGNQQSTRFFKPPFFSISINPILLLIQDDHTFYDVLSPLIHIVCCIGEMYNLISEVEMIHELIIVDQYASLNELRGRVGRLHINPLRGWRGLYGLRALSQYETLIYGLTHIEVQQIRRYGTESAALIFREEGMYHYQKIADLCGLIESSGPRTAVFILPNKYRKSRRARFENVVFQKFDERFRALREEVLDFMHEIEDIMDNARTTVQLNVAVVALIITAFLTVLPFLVSSLAPIVLRYGNFTRIP